MINKFNVVTLGSRDYYQVSIALHERGLLGYLVTDFYSKNPSFGESKKRHCKELQDAGIFSLYPFAFLAKILAVHTKLHGTRRFFVDFLFGFFSAFITCLTTDRAIVYSYYVEGFVAFYKLIGKRPKNLICFQVHPTPWYINKIIAEDADNVKQSMRVEFLKDIEVSYKNSEMYKYVDAIRFCDSVICASTFTARSLLDGSGLAIDKLIVPYGSKLETGPPVVYAPGKKIRLVTVCQLTQRKGMHWAFEAMKCCGYMDAFEWVVVANKVDPGIQALAPSNVKFASNLSNDELASIFGNSDLFVMPSLVEGFGLVYIEALSKGLPIVYTENTGPDDFCTNGVHGFKVDCGSLESMVDLFKKLVEQPVDLTAMRPACTVLAQDTNWENFRLKISNFVENK